MSVMSLRLFAPIAIALFTVVAPPAQAPGLPMR
jgi:hypothetical protein